MHDNALSPEQMDRQQSQQEVIEVLQEGYYGLFFGTGIDKLDLEWDELVPDLWHNRPVSA